MFSSRICKTTKTLLSNNLRDKHFPSAHGFSHAFIRYEGAVSDEGKGMGEGRGESFQRQQSSLLKQLSKMRRWQSSLYIAVIFHYTH